MRSKRRSYGRSSESHASLPCTGSGRFEGSQRTQRLGQPPDAQQPKLGLRERLRLLRRVFVAPPGRQVLARVAPIVADHIANGIGDLPARLQHVRVVAVGEHGAGPSEVAVQPPRDPHTKPLHSAREPDRVLGLDDEMQVIALDGVVRDAHPIALRSIPKRAQHHLRRPLLPQVADAGPQPLRHMHRATRCEWLAGQMGNEQPDHSRILAQTRPPGAGLLSAALPKRQRELLRLTATSGSPPPAAPAPSGPATRARRRPGALRGSSCEPRSPPRAGRPRCAPPRTGRAPRPASSRRRPPPAPVAGAHR